jgi:hypothetical protein
MRPARLRIVLCVIVAGLILLVSAFWMWLRVTGSEFRFTSEPVEQGAEP